MGTLLSILKKRTVEAKVTLENNLEAFSSQLLKLIAVQLLLENSCLRNRIDKKRVLNLRLVVTDKNHSTYSVVGWHSRDAPVYGFSLLAKNGLPGLSEACSMKSV